MSPQRIQRKRIKGWRMPPNTVSVARPSPWGNPWRVGVHCETAAEAVTLYRSYLAGPAKTVAEAARKELRGKNLACFCPLHLPCHADVLLELANS